MSDENKQMNVAWWKFRNSFRKAKNRLRYPPPIYKKVGGIDAVVIRKDGRKEDLGKVSHTYAKRWGTGTGAGQ